MAVAELRRRRVEEEGESVFVSMTDLTVSFLFILLVLLAFFATQFQPEEMVPRSEYETLVGRLSEADADRRRLEEVLASERQQLERLDRERRELTARLAEAERTIGELRALVESLRTELAAATANIDTLSAQIEALRRQLELMRTEGDEARARIATLTDQLGQQRRELAARLAEAERTIGELRALVESLRAELAEATENADTLSAQIEALRRQLELTRAERDEARARIAAPLEQIEQERRELAARLAEAERTIGELRALVDSLRAELATATANIDLLSAQVEALHWQLEFIRTERDETRARVALLKDQVAQLQQSVADSMRERDRLRAQLSEMMDPDSLAAYLEDASEAREALLERLAEQIRQRLPGIQVTVDTTDGIIRFRADELFPPGTWRIPSGSLAERVSYAVGDALAETLPCYTLSPSLDTEVTCEGAVAAIETIQIEGHTDNVGLSVERQEREQMRDNYDLSARRGAETLRVMTRYRPELHQFLNLRRQPVLSFAGYGETRPINQDEYRYGEKTEQAYRHSVHSPDAAKSSRS